MNVSPVVYKKIDGLDVDMSELSNNLRNSFEMPQSHSVYILLEVNFDRSWLSLFSIEHH